MYTFIVNPNSRSGKGLDIWKLVERDLQKRQVQYTVFFTKYQNHATSFVRELTSNDTIHTLIVLGGDGTLNEVVNGIVSPDKITLGYIPTGSGNDFARSFGISKDPLQALESILNPHQIVDMDIGIIRFEKKERRFAVSTGIGFDASICHEAVVSKWKRLLNRIHLGKFTYALIAIHQLIVSSTFQLNILLDGAEPFHLSDCWFAAVMNHPCEGGGFYFCPDAKPDDGYLDLLIVSGLKSPALLISLLLALFGLHTRLPGMHLYRCKNVSIESSCALPVHTDGEPIFLQRCFTASTADFSLKIIIS